MTREGNGELSVKNIRATNSLETTGSYLLLKKLATVTNNWYNSKLQIEFVNFWIGDRSITPN